MKFKYFKITETETLDHIEECLLSISQRKKALADLNCVFGSRDCFAYTRGDVAYFAFNSRPCKESWKKVKHGYMPKVKSKEYKILSNIPEQLDYNNIIEKYSFGNEMMIGDQVAGGTGFRMHSSYIRGSRKTNFYLIVVPYSDEFDREVHSSLVEIKEWEMMKGIDSSD